MFKMILAFVVLSIVIASGIQIFRESTGKERWMLTKIAGFAMMSSAIAVAILTVFVFLF